MIDLLVIPVIKIVAIILFIIVTVIIYVWFERRVWGFIQSRLGPNRVGPLGLLQMIADTLKLLIKEDIIPRKADRFVFNLAPILVVVPIIAVFGLIPFGEGMKIFGRDIGFYLASTDVALLFIIAFSSLSVFGFILGGWASNSKYPLLGSLRAASQMISYEVALGLSLVPVLFFSHSLNLFDIVYAQRNMGVWFAFIQPIAFFIYFVAGLAETNRTPFDLPDAESEIVGGFHTEYSGIKFAFFFLAEYAHIILVSALATVMFLGGWLAPFHSVPSLIFLDRVPGPVWFLLKMGFFMFVFTWVRGTFPRYRYDQLMELSWKRLIPLAMANLVVTGLIVLVVRK